VIDLRAPRARWAAAAASLLTVTGLWALVISRGEYIDAPPPATREDVHPVSSPPPSVISVPLEIPIRPLVALVEGAVPRAFGDLEQFERLPTNDRVRVAFELERTPFRASVADDIARLQTTVLYAVRFSYGLPALPDLGGSCGVDGPRPRLIVTIESPISLDEEWGLRTRARVGEVLAASDESRDRCQVTFLGLDVTDLLLDAVRSFLVDSTGDIDELASRVDTRSRFQEWWATLRRPIELDDSLWLAMRPERVRRGPLRGSGDTITVDIALTARPSVDFGARPAIDSVPLPALDSGDVRSHLDLRVDARAGYEAASGLLTERIGGHRVDFEGRSLTVDSLRVYGIGGGRLAMEVLLSGDVRGRLFLTGRPVIDSTTGEISVPDLDFDVATRDLLLSTVAWLAGPTLREDLRERAHWPGDPAVAWLAAWLREGLNRNISAELSVSGEVETLEILDVHALTQVLLVRVAATGTARLEVR
jgi:hypothetical protein